MAASCARCGSAEWAAVFIISTFTPVENPMIAHPWGFNMVMCAPCAQHMQIGIYQLVQPALGLPKEWQQTRTLAPTATVTPLKIVKPQKKETDD